jgi:two-component system LytT family response regulator
VTSPEKINALLVDDEPLACVRLRELLAAHPAIEVVATAASVAEARTVLNLSGRQPGALLPAIDVVFLDVEMPGGSGLSLLEWVPQETLVVFVTAYRQYALQAFDCDALDYLLKPIDPQRLENTLERIYQQIPALQTEAATDPEMLSSETFGHTLIEGDGSISAPLATGRGVQQIRLNDICWIEALRNYTQVYFRRPERDTLFRRRLAQWQADLPVDRFVRLSKSLLVNIPVIMQTEWRSRDETLLTFFDRTNGLTIRRQGAIRLREILATGISTGQADDPVS